jgi:hypothetical protein
VFVCSNDTHALLFEPIARTLASRGWLIRAMSLDQFYAQGATSSLATLGLPVVEVRRNRGALGSSFYDRNIGAIWRDVLEARRPIRQQLVQSDPSVVVLGNDRGLLEKLVIRSARRLGYRTVLVQDGLIAATQPRPASTMDRMRGVARRFGSRILHRLGIDYLASSRYGQGGADVVCVTGPITRQTVLDLGVSERRVVVTGQPRYDSLAQIPRAPTKGRVVWFTTPFQMARLGLGAQLRQLALAHELANELYEQGWHLIVKPHPREVAEAYETQIAPHGAVSMVSAGEALAEAEVAIVGISSVVEEASLLRVPVVVPGRTLHGDRFEAVLPPADRFPRFESAAEAAALCTVLTTGDGRQALLAGQRAYVDGLVSVDPKRPAAARVADVIELAE